MTGRCCPLKSFALLAASCKLCFGVIIAVLLGISLRFLAKEETDLGWNFHIAAVTLQVVIIAASIIMIVGISNGFVLWIIPWMVIVILETGWVGYIFVFAIRTAIILADLYGIPLLMAIYILGNVFAIAAGGLYHNEQRKLKAQEEIVMKEEPSRF